MSNIFPPIKYTCFPCFPHPINRVVIQGLSSRDFDLSDYTADRVRNDVTYLSYYTKNRDAVGTNAQGEISSSIMHRPSKNLTR